MEKKMLFLFNPKAGRSEIKNSLADILNIFTKGIMKFWCIRVNLGKILKKPLCEKALILTS